MLGLVFGFLGGLTLFVATNWLVIKGGEPVGPHLQLLNQFFVGYSVSFIGSLVGMAYGFMVGYPCGWFIARIHNRMAVFKE